MGGKSSRPQYQWSQKSFSFAARKGDERKGELKIRFSASNRKFSLYFTKSLLKLGLILINLGCLQAKNNVYSSTVTNLMSFIYIHSCLDHLAGKESYFNDLFGPTN